MRLLRSGRRPVAVLGAALAALVLVLLPTACGSSGPAPAPDGTVLAADESSGAPSAADRSGTASAHPSGSPTPSVRVAPRVNAVTPEGLWWGVDSSGPVGDEPLAAVQHWYQGATPTVWGRYLVGGYALRPGETEWAAAHQVYLYLIVPDDNCSECAGGGDICGNDRTADQATADAQAALAAARERGVGRGARLYKDLEQVGSCRGEPTGEYVDTWYRTVSTSEYRVGLYGNTTEPDWDFPTAYCAALALDPAIGTDVVIAGNEPEPQIGAPAGESGPATAPPFAPFAPPCAPAGTTHIWQYGESTDPDNYADVDEVLPGTTGLLAPDGTVTGGPGPD